MAINFPRLTGVVLSLLAGNSGWPSAFEEEEEAGEEELEVGIEIEEMGDRDIESVVVEKGAVEEVGKKSERVSVTGKEMGCKFVAGVIISSESVEVERLDSKEMDGKRVDVEGIGTVISNEDAMTEGRKDGVGTVVLPCNEKVPETVEFPGERSSGFSKTKSPP